MRALARSPPDVPHNSGEQPGKYGRQRRIGGSPAEQQQRSDDEHLLLALGIGLPDEQPAGKRDDDRDSGNAKRHQHQRDRRRIANRNHGDAAKHRQHGGRGRPRPSRCRLARPMKTPSMPSAMTMRGSSSSRTDEDSRLSPYGPGANPQQQQQRGRGPRHHFSITTTRCSFPRRSRPEGSRRPAATQTRASLVRALATAVRRRP